MRKLATFLIAAALSVPVASAADGDADAVMTYQEPTSQSGTIPSVHVDRGTGFKRLGQEADVWIDDRVRVMRGAVVKLTYPSGCVKTLEREGIYVVRRCDLADEDGDQDPDQELDEEENEDSEDLDSQDSTEGSGGDSLLTPRNLLLTGTGVVLGKEIYDELKDNDGDGDPVSP